MKKLCILIPTYENTEALAYLLDVICPEAYEANIDIYICDSSKTSSNRQLVRYKVNDGYKNVFFMAGEMTDYINLNYDKFDEPDYKVVMAEKILTKKYEYIWLSADGYILKIKELKDVISRFMKEKIDIIHLDDSCNDKKIIYYNDCKRFYSNDSWHMTKFSSAIIASKVIEKMNSQEAFEKYYGSCFLVLMSIFDYCARNKFIAVRFNCNYYKENPLKKASGWILKGIALNIFCKNWHNANQALPMVYDSIKERAIMNHSIKSGVFDYKRCIRLRAYGDISYFKVKKYRKLIPKITKTSIWWFSFLSIVPSVVCKIVVEIYDRLKVEV